MSVLNRVLRDLERRGEGQPKAMTGPVAVTPVVRPSLPAASPRPSQLLRIVIWSGVGLVLAGTAGTYVWIAQQGHTTAQAPQPLGAHQYAAVVTATPPAEVPTPPVATDVVAPAIASSAVATEESNINERRAPSADRTPARESMTTSTSSIAPVALAKPSRTTVNPATDAPAVTAAVAPTRPAPQVQAALTDATSRPAAITAVASKPTSATTAPDAALGAAPSAPSAGSETAAAIVMRPGGGAAADEARATELIRRGRNVEAMALLQGVLTQAPANGNARATLAALQSETGHRELALQTLLAGSQIEPMRFAALAAQLQADLGDAAAALITLDRIAATARSARIEALRGGIAQRAGQHAVAVDSYQRALRSADAPAVWWVGLAVSLDALGQATQSHAAFSRAATDASLPAGVRSFVHARIAALAAAGHAAAAASTDAAIAASR